MCYYDDQSDEDRALDIIERICEKAMEVPDNEMDFAESVSKKARSIRFAIVVHDRVSDAQLEALESMELGLERRLR